MERKRYQRKFLLFTPNVITSFWNGLALIVNKKWKNKIYKLGNVDDRIPVLQLTRSRGKKQKESEKMFLNQAQD